jgi:hypothetical protein
VSAPAWLLDADREYAEHVEEGLAGVLPAGLQRVGRGRLPAIRAAVRGALEAAGEGGGPLACRHVLADALDGASVGGPSLCARHPDAGVHCGPCADEHRDGHGAAGACDECGEGGWLRPFAQPVAVRRFIVRGLDGRTRVAVGPLLVEGLSVCGGCYDGAQR